MCQCLRWIKCATDVLRNNNVHPYVFAAAVRDLLEHGRGKHRNILLSGPADTGKTFLLEPLKKLFSRTKCNPSSTKFAWVGGDEADIILLNDFRWRTEQIQWHDLLLLLEGQTVHLPAPMNTYSKEVTVSSDVPIFGTSIGEIVYQNRSNEVDQGESEMMSVRWKTFKFHKRINKRDQIILEPCCRCFSRLILLGEDVENF